MDLLLSIKDFYKKLVDFKLLDEQPNLATIEQTAEEIYQGNYSTIDKYIVITLAPEKYATLKELRNKIEEISNNDK